MKVLLNEETIKELIERYFKEQLDIDGIASVKVSKEYVYHGVNESLECVVEFIITGTMTLSGKTYETKITISYDEVVEAIKYCFEKEGYVFKEMHLKKQIDYVSQGYGLSERQVGVPKFEGIEVKIDRNKKVKEKI